jgi:hypothetical protein
MCNDPGGRFAQNGALLRAVSALADQVCRGQKVRAVWKCRPADSAHEIPRVSVKRAGDAHQGRQAGVSPASLDLAVVGDVHLREVCHIFLAESRLVSNLQEALPHDLGGFREFMRHPSCLFVRGVFRQSALTSSVCALPHACHETCYRSSNSPAALRFASRSRMRSSKRSTGDRRASSCGTMSLVIPRTSSPGSTPSRDRKGTTVVTD